MHYELNEKEASLIEAYRIANEDVKCLFDACTGTANKTQEGDHEAIGYKDLEAANVEMFEEGSIEDLMNEARKFANDKWIKQSSFLWTI